MVWTIWYKEPLSTGKLYLIINVNNLLLCIYNLLVMYIRDNFSLDGE